MFSQTAEKLYDISFATFRVAALVKNAKLRLELQNVAVDLIVSPLHGNERAVSIESLWQLVQLGESIGEIKKINASVLKRELQGVHSSIQKSNGNLEEDIDISGLFSKRQDKKYSQIPNGKDDSKRQSQQETVIVSSPVVSHSTHILPGDNIADRQTAIMDAIRQIRFCRLRNLVEKFPHISERTIRNDIQALVEKNLVRRIGGGGPNSYFQTLELAPISL